MLFICSYILSPDILSCRLDKNRTNCPEQMGIMSRARPATLPIGCQSAQTTQQPLFVSVSHHPSLASLLQALRNWNLFSRLAKRSMFPLVLFVAFLLQFQNATAAVSPDLSVLVDGYNIICKVPCLSCPFLVESTASAQKEPWSERRDDNALVSLRSTPSMRGEQYPY